MTNYERIKQMSVEEISRLMRGNCPYTFEPTSAERRKEGIDNCLSNMSCHECRIKWLESEVD